MQEPDFLAFGPLLLERLRQRIDAPAETQWFLSTDLKEVINTRSQFAPAIHVLYGGYRPSDEKGNGKLQLVDVTWIVLVSVSNAAGGEQRRAEAGPRMGKVCSAVMGWPRAGRSTQFRPLRLAGAPAPIDKDIVTHFPIAFVHSMPVEGNPD